MNFGGNVSSHNMTLNSFVENSIAQAVHAGA